LGHSKILNCAKQTNNNETTDAKETAHKESGTFIDQKQLFLLCCLPFKFKTPFHLLYLLLYSFKKFNNILKRIYVMNHNKDNRVQYYKKKLKIFCNLFHILIQFLFIMLLNSSKKKMNVAF
ncbi:hypothetical protein RFI_37194, partial [Reticulomyxa filosa]